MKKSNVNTFLALVLGAALLISLVVRTFAPNVIIPGLNIPNMVLISLAALVLERPGAKRCWPCVFVLGALTFGLLPFAACFVGGQEALKLGLIGGLVFTVTTALYTTMSDRLSTGPAARLAPAASALCLWLASQCFAGILL